MLFKDIFSFDLNVAPCDICHRNHNLKECNKEIINKCVKCIRANKNINIGLNENHSTTDGEKEDNAYSGLTIQQIYGIYTNICVIINNYNQLEVIVNKQNSDFIILSETHLTWDIEEQGIQLIRYNSYITHSNSNRTGGVVVYFRQQYTVIKNWRKVL